MKKIIICLALVWACAYPFRAGYAIDGQPGHIQTMSFIASVKYYKEKMIDTATFATGCFWCTEAQFKQLKGVKKLQPGIRAAI